MNVQVKAGQSLWSIAKQQLPRGAGDATIQQAVADIAKANGLAPGATLRVGQSLTIPDRFAGAVASDPTVGGAVGRLSNPNRTNAVLLQTANTTAPWVNLKAVFVPTRSTPEQPVTLPAVAGVPVEAQRVRLEGVKSSLGASATQAVEARLGKLTQAQFDAVKTELGGRSNVGFDPQRSYVLQDFLPPALQALLHQDLEVGEPVTLKGTKGKGEDMAVDKDRQISLTMNCHATAWEAVRAYQGEHKEVAIFYGEMIAMDGHTTDANKFAPVAELTAAELSKLGTLPLQPGDVVQFHEVSEWARMTMLLHSAVYVGGGLFFEKPNTEGAGKDDPANYVKQDETPFRLATPELMAAPLSDAVEGKFRMVVLRPKEKLEDPAQAFASSWQKELSTMAAKKGRTLGVEVVSEIEQGMGGNIRAEHPSALVRVGLVNTATGNSALKT